LKASKQAFDFIQITIVYSDGQDTGFSQFKWHSYGSLRDQKRSGCLKSVFFALSPLLLFGFASFFAGDSYRQCQAEAIEDNRSTLFGSI
jgi:hypothetical protein